MVMVGEFVGGAALGAAFGILFDVVKEALEKSAKFKPLLQTIKSSLDSLQPVFQQIEMHNSELNLPTEEIESCLEQMEEGVELVRKHPKFPSGTTRSLVTLINLLSWMDPLRE